MAESYDRMNLFEEVLLSDVNNLKRISDDENSIRQYLNNVGLDAKEKILKLIMPTLYHGTDLRIIRMNEIKRIQLRDAVELANNYLWSLYKERWSNAFVLEGTDGFPPNLKELKNEVIQAVRCVSSYHNGAKRYKYEKDVVYLTTLPVRACDFAYGAFAYGEIGLFTFRLIQGLRYMNFKNFAPSDEERNAINAVIAFASENPQPAVFVLDNLDPSKLKSEGSDSNFDINNIYGFQNCKYTDSSILRACESKLNYIPLNDPECKIGILPDYF